jgi:uncharacterized Zn-binding protein involved in type VI secretion
VSFHGTSRVAGARQSSPVIAEDGEVTRIGGREAAATKGDRTYSGNDIIIVDRRESKAKRGVTP